MNLNTENTELTEMNFHFRKRSSVGSVFSVLKIF